MARLAQARYPAQILIFFKLKMASPSILFLGLPRQGQVVILRPAGLQIFPRRDALGLTEKWALKNNNIWAGYLAWARWATTRLFNTLLCSEQQQKHCSRKTLQCSHLKNTNTARAAWSQLSTAPCVILLFIDYIG